MDAISLLKDDHKTVERLFRRYEKAGPRAYAEKQAVVELIITELSVHAAIEEQLFYPVTRAAVAAVEDDALESLEEHHIVKWLLSELSGMSPEHERFDAKVTVLMENVRHHVEEEQDDYFPKVRDGMDRKSLRDLGQKMAAAKAGAPTHPHPRLPDTPPGNIVVGAAAVVDRALDTVLRRNKAKATPKAKAPAKRAASPAKRVAKTSAKRVASATRKTAKRPSAAKAVTKGRKVAKATAKRTAKRTTTTAKRTATTAKRTVKRAR